MRNSQLGRSPDSFGSLIARVGNVSRGVDRFVRAHLEDVAAALEVRARSIGREIAVVRPDLGSCWPVARGEESAACAWNV
jgi:hypothetical protein